MKNNSSNFLDALPPSAKRMYFRLKSHGPTITMDVRTELAIGNPSDAASRFNAAAVEAGDPRRIKCRKKPMKNRYGQPIQVGEWYVAQVSAANDANY